MAEKGRTQSQFGGRLPHLSISLEKLRPNLLFYFYLKYYNITRHTNIPVTLEEKFTSNKIKIMAQSGWFYNYKCKFCV